MGPRAAAFLLISGLLPAPAQTIPNPDFRDGEAVPSAWTLSGGQGRWVNREILEVAGNGGDANAWASSPLALLPGALYRFQVRLRRPEGQGCIVAGPSFANRDLHGAAAEWRWFGHVCRAPDDPAGAHLRLGQWQATGRVQFDAVRLARCLPVHIRVAGIPLGEGEALVDGVYSFTAGYGGPGSNDHRPLVSATAGFNSDRWVFAGGDQVTYRFELPDSPFSEAGFGFQVNHHVRGSCLAEAAAEGGPWRQVAAREGVGIALVERLPAEFFPAKSLLVRLRAAPGASFQVDGLEFQGRVKCSTDGTGTTEYADLLESAPGWEAAGLWREKGAAGDELHLALKNLRDRELEIRLEEYEDWRGGPPPSSPRPAVRVGPGRTAPLRLPLPPPAPGSRRLRLGLAAGEEPGRMRLELAWTVSELHRSDYGWQIEGTGGEVWWAQAPWRVSRLRPPPAATSRSAAMAAARNDFEALQVVVRPSRPLAGFTAAAADLVGPGGAAIPAREIAVEGVFHHPVRRPTDASSAVDLWPDALVPLGDPFHLPAGENLPLWVRVRVPAEAPPGDYRGELRLTAAGWSATVPLALHVWDVLLPERNHVATAFGFDFGLVCRYQRLSTEAEKRRVLDLYLRSFAEHRISPYDPAPLDPIRVRFLPEAEPPRAELDFAAFDRAMAKAVTDYRFTHFRLPVLGLGGGTFHSRREPEIAGFGAGTPQYEALLGSYLSRLESHLRRRGLLDLAYVYWFDEPAPPDYGFVAAGMERLQRHAPGLARMLTEEPNAALRAPVDIWCPVTPAYDHAVAQTRRAAGERFWWYLCTQPKAPWCTLFLDHPATELRIWLWQAWERGIVGILVWQTNYWTSAAAFPDGLQDPYLDPMSYVGGYSTPPGVKRCWGNGDGRFLYPPLAARPWGEGPPVLAGPAGSIRWEMLREGIEDYELLHLLRETLDASAGRLAPAERARYEALLAVPAAITRDLTTFTTDPAPIYARRADVAAAIERLQAARKK